VRAAEFGIVIGDKNYWSRGYGTDAVTTLTGFGFGELNLQRIWLRVFDFNTRAIRCYEKSGFVLEGRLRRHHYHAG
jgi:RimJ/RimL family protein N-acetyltransferase